MKAKIKELSLQIAVLMIFNGLLAECSLLEKLQTRLREKFKGNLMCNSGLVTSFTGLFLWW